MAIEMFSWPSLHERTCRTWGSNSVPLACQAPGIWLSAWRFLLTHCLDERAAEVLARLRGCAGSPEPSLLAWAISTKFAWRGPFSISQSSWLFQEKLRINSTVDHNHISMVWLMVHWWTYINWCFIFGPISFFGEWQFTPLRSQTLIDTWTKAVNILNFQQCGFTRQ